MSEKPQSTYRLDIQGLRALAVLAVIANHFSKTILPNGFLGVDIFFVISGFVITSLLNTAQPSSLITFIVEFYERRIKRLFPALILCVMVTTLFSVIFIAPWQNQFYGPAWHTGLAALAGLANIYLYSLSMDYFGGSAELNPFTQTWSLGVEEQFYLAYPILFWATMRCKTKNALLVIMSTLGVMSVLAYLWLNKSNPSAAFYFMPTRFWELALGCIAFYFTRQLQTRGLAEVLLAALVGIIIFAGTWPVSATLAVVFITALLLATPAPQSIASKILSSKIAVYVGAISYPLYLWHWSVLSISRWTIGVDLRTAPLQLALIFGLAAATHKWVETPIKQLVWSRSKPRTIAIGLGSLLVGMAMVSILGSPLKGSLYAGSRFELKSSTSGSAELHIATATARAALANCNLTPDDLTGEKFKPRPIVDNTFYSRCLASAQPKIILTGDSFSEAIAPHIAMIAARLGRDFKTVMGYGCPFPLKLEGQFAVETHCNIDIDFMKKKIVEQINAGDIVVVRLSFAKPQYVKIDGRALNAIGIYDLELEDLRLNVEAKGGKLLLIGANLTQEFSPACLNSQWFNSKLTAACAMGVAFESSFENNFSAALDRHLSAQLPEKSYFSVLKPLCDFEVGVCKTSEQGAYLYDDASHLNASAFDLFLKDLQIAIVKAALN